MGRVGVDKDYREVVMEAFLGLMLILGVGWGIYMVVRAAIRDNKEKPPEKQDIDAF